MREWWRPDGSFILPIGHAPKLLAAERPASGHTRQTVLASQFALLIGRSGSWEMPKTPGPLIAYLSVPTDGATETPPKSGRSLWNTETYFEM
jgi:hypothetical protein